MSRQGGLLMAGNVLPFRKPATRERVSPIPGGRYRVTGFAVALQSRPGSVFLITDHVELGLTPEQARSLAEDLLELADDADGGVSNG